MIIFIQRIPFIDNFLIQEKVDPVRDVLGKFIPGISDLVTQVNEALSFKGSTINTVGSIFAIILSMLVTTWIASGGFAKIIFTQSHIYEHKFIDGYWSNRFRGMMMVIYLTLGLFFSLLFNTLIVTLINRLSIDDWAKDLILYTFLIFGIFLLTSVGFTLFFRFSPRYKIKIRQVIPGGMVAALPSSLFLIFFGSISSLWSYGNYGSVGAIMYIAMTALILSIFLFTGIIANSAYYKTFVGEKIRTKRKLF